MRKKISAILAIVLILCMALSAPAMAADDAQIHVRVNGALVEFPDGQPYIDANGRTLIPVRFVAEAMGADVSWDNDTRTAIIEKDGTKIELPLYKDTFTVSKDGETYSVTMDTCAVLTNERTYVPIRFVAEELGAYVDYASAYKTVGIYSGVLSPEQIEELRSYDYTHIETAVSYERAKETYSTADLLKYFGDKRESFADFANAHEFLYSDVNNAVEFDFNTIGMTLFGSDNTAFYEAVVDEAKAEIGYSSENLTVEFVADTSCVYQEDHVSGITAAVRGYVVANINVKPTALNGEEMALLSSVGFTQLTQGVEMRIPVDVHMSTISSGTVGIIEVVAL